MKQFTDTVRNDYDYILIDAPAGVGSGFITAITPADRAIIVTNAEPTGVRGALNVRSILLQNDVKDIRLIINKFSEKSFRELGVYRDLDEVIDKCETQLIGIVPEDYQLVTMSQQGRPNLNNSPSTLAFDKIADRIMGKNTLLAFPKKI